MGRSVSTTMVNVYQELERKLTATRLMEGILADLYEANVVLREIEQLRLSIVVTREWATMLMLEAR